MMASDEAATAGLESSSNPNIAVDAHHLMATYRVSVPLAADPSQTSPEIVAKATVATTALVEALFDLPVERSRDGPIASLPAGTTPLPRAKPVPAAKAKTKWEEFAEKKGIAKKTKKGRMVWDEATGQWAPAWGYQRASSANDDDADAPIIEVSEKDLHVDPRAERDAAKKARVEKNDRKRLANDRRAGRAGAAKVLPNEAARSGPAKSGGESAVASSSAAPESSKARRAATKPSHSKESTNARQSEAFLSPPLPAGIPVDLEAPGASSFSSGEKKRKRGKASVDATLAAAQRSTASLGKFDARREGETKPKERGKKRAFAPVVSENGLASEIDRSVRLMEDVLRPKAKAPAKGERETFDTHDGELPVDLKRKKGRLAAGKARKVTKKRT